VKIICCKRLVPCAGDDPGNGAIDDAVLVLDGDRIAAVGNKSLLEAHPGAARVHHDGLVTPGLVDAHTHAVWTGSRANEYAMRMHGADYEKIGKAGGGIVASMRAVRNASVDELCHELCARLSRMAAMGVTTVEVKSGYGLDEVSERKQLEAIAGAAERDDLPQVVPTFLGLHALPPEASSRDDYAASVLRWLDPIARDNLARWVDAYIDRSAFSVEQARPVLERARELGLGVRMHVGQFADVGGAELAASLGAASADHLEHISVGGAAALAEAGVAAVVLPIASYTLGQEPPPIARLRDAGVSLVVASDANPGTAPSESLPLAMSLAVRSYGLSVTEMLLGVTARAASSLSLDSGVLRAGAPADVVLWDLPHEDALAQPWGVPKTRAVLRGGKVIAGALSVEDMPA
jgi:imidazolonepropionase